MHLGDQPKPHRSQIDPSLAQPPICGLPRYRRHQHDLAYTRQITALNAGKDAIPKRMSTRCHAFRYVERNVFDTNAPVSFVYKRSPLILLDIIRVRCYSNATSCIHRASTRTRSFHSELASEDHDEGEQPRMCMQQDQQPIIKFEFDTSQPYRIAFTDEWLRFRKPRPLPSHLTVSEDNMSEDQKVIRLDDYRKRDPAQLLAEMIARYPAPDLLDIIDWKAVNQCLIEAMNRLNSS